jgi:hypothetical protein
MMASEELRPLWAASEWIGNITRPTSRVGKGRERGIGG